MAKKKSSKSSKPKKSSSSTTSKWHAVPLKSSFMVISILGMLITGYSDFNTNYKFAFMMVFFAMFAASLVSMTKAPISS